LNNKNIIITGASSGIGRQTAIEASRSGANVILIARNKEKLEDARKALSPGKHFIFPFDLNDLSSIESLIEEISGKTGILSGFVHSAGMELTMPFRNMKPEQYEQLFKINVIAGFEFARVLSKKKYVNPDGAAFVFISSVMGKFGKEGKVGYCASKGALISSVKALALELSSKKIRCNAVLPGIVETEMVRKMFEDIPEAAVSEIIRQHPLGIGYPEDVAHLIVFLLSEKARWITGSEFVIDGGYSAQ
jgi:NAD(P)-dependent dehydrogenase (short-subunit alcohol dehydrogenase family)